MKKKGRGPLRKFLGWCFLILGLLGLFLPFLQGILFILVGLYLLSTEYYWAERIFFKVKRRFPKLARTLEVAKAKAKNILQRFRK